MPQTNRTIRAHSLSWLPAKLSGPARLVVSAGLLFPSSVARIDDPGADAIPIKEVDILHVSH